MRKQLKGYCRLQVATRRCKERRAMAVLAYLSTEDGSTGSINFVTGVKRQGAGVTAGALRHIRERTGSL